MSPRSRQRKQRCSTLLSLFSPVQILARRDLAAPVQRSVFELKCVDLGKPKVEAKLDRFPSQAADIR